MSERNSAFCFVLPEQLEMAHLGANLVKFVSEAHNSIKVDVMNDDFTYALPPRLEQFKVGNVEDYLSRKASIFEEESRFEQTFLINGSPDDDVQLQLAVEYRLALMYVNNNVFRYQEYIDIWVGLSKLFYSLLKPIYGYGLIELQDLKRPALEVIDSGRIDTLYAYNFWGPGLVESLGLDKLGSIDGWRVERLDDGGRLIIMTSNRERNDWQLIAPKPLS